MFIRNTALLAVSLSTFVASSFAALEKITALEALTRLYGKESAIPKDLQKSIGSCNFIKVNEGFGPVWAPHLEKNGKSSGLYMDSVSKKNNDLKFPF